MDEITDKQKAFLEKKGVKVAYGMSKQEASKMIDELINKNKPKDEAMYAPINSNAGLKPKFDTSSYYVAYAKDLCVAMLNAHVEARKIDNQIEPIAVGDLMIAAVVAIQKARKEFQ